VCLIDTHTLAADLDEVTMYNSGRLNFGRSGAFIAIDRDYYEQSGLEVNLRFLVKDDAKVLSHMKGKEGVYGLVSTWALRDHFSGDDFVVFGAMFQATNYGLLINREKGVTSPRDLANHTVLMQEGEASAEVRAMLNEQGVLDKIVWDRREGGVNDVAKGRVDAVLVRFNPSVIGRLAEVDFEWSMLMPYSYGIRFYNNVMVTTRQEVDNHPERVMAFYHATVQGYRYALTHPNEVIDRYLEKQVPDPERKPDVRRYLETQAWHNLGSINVDHVGPVEPSHWREIVNMLEEMGDAERVESLDRFLFDPTPEPNLAWVPWVGGGAGGVVILAMGVVMWNRQLSRRVRQRTESLERSERRRALMMQELDHRVKNNLATVLSLSNQTLDTADSLKAFGTTFTGRLMAMAKSHEALAADAWEGIDLRHVAELALGPHMSCVNCDDDGVNEVDGDGVVCVKGARMKLPSKASIPLSMALHELSTNATKYGALSERATSGRVAISWELEGEWLAITWRERGGPRIEGPIVPGVGVVLIKDLLEYDLNCCVVMDFSPEGLCCVIKIPRVEYFKREESLAPEEVVSSDATQDVLASG
jgi:two-component sensor histidine kinase/ABC-type nitrate/sulfonate/bicarbonate transport system substrate-binding protein